LSRKAAISFQHDVVLTTKQLRLRFQSSDNSLPQFWQPRFYHFNVWSQKKFVEKLRYMIPLKRKLILGVDLATTFTSEAPPFSKKL
jgi:hypothetical protein